MAFLVRPWRPDDCQGWDQFVERHVHGTPFHLMAWKKTIEAVFPYRPNYLLAEEDGQIRAILPLFLVKSPIMGTVLVSSPFAVYGGILAASREAQDAIRTHAARLAEQERVQYVEFRNAFVEQCNGLPRLSRYATFTRPLITGAEELLTDLPKKTRNMVRKALKYPYSARSQPSDLSAFIDLYSRSLRRLGTPAFPVRHFEALRANFGPMLQVREILLEGRVVAASISLLFRDSMHAYYEASDEHYLAYAPNNYLYFDHLCWASRNGFRVFDFGRSKKDTGVFDFKRHWGAEIRELPYEIMLFRKKELPNYSPLNPKFRLATNAWKHLPLSVTRALGPHLIKWFP